MESRKIYEILGAGRSCALTLCGAGLEENVCVCQRGMGSAETSDGTLGASIPGGILNVKLKKVPGYSPFTYFGLFAVLALNGRRMLLDTQQRKQAKSLTDYTKKFSDNFPLVEFGLFPFLTLLSATIGAASGVVWWTAGGYVTHSLTGALYVGALTVIFIFAGP